MIELSKLKDAGGGRGLNIITFVDDHCENCSIQDSSAAEEPCIWLGVSGSGSRMHLSQRDVQILLPILQHFAATGELRDPSDITQDPKDLHISLLNGKLANLKATLQEGIAELYDIHPDDLYS